MRLPAFGTAAAANRFRRPKRRCMAVRARPQQRSAVAGGRVPHLIDPPADLGGPALCRGTGRPPTRAVGTSPGRLFAAEHRLAAGDVPSADVFADHRIHGPAVRENAGRWAGPSSGMRSARPAYRRPGCPARTLPGRVDGGGASEQLAVRERPGLRRTSDSSAGPNPRQRLRRVVLKRRAVEPAPRPRRTTRRRPEERPSASWRPPSTPGSVDELDDADLSVVAAR